MRPRIRPDGEAPDGNRGAPGSHVKPPEGAWRAGRAPVRCPPDAFASGGPADQTTEIRGRARSLKRLLGIMAWTPLFTSTTCVTRKLTPRLQSE